MEKNLFEKYFKIMDRNPSSEEATFIILGFDRLQEKKGKRYLIGKIDQHIEYILSQAEGATFSNRLAQKLMILWLEKQKISSFGVNYQLRLLKVLVTCISSSYKEEYCYITAKAILRKLPMSILQEHFAYFTQIYKQGNINYQVIGELLQKLTRTGYLDKENSMIQDILMNV